MAQPVSISLHISPWPVVAAVLVSQIIYRDRFMDAIGHRFNNILDTVYAVSKKVVLESPVTVLAAGLTYGVHQLTTYAPALALSTEGSMKVAIFVGGIFLLKSALSPVLETATVTDSKKHAKHATIIRNSVVRNFFPLVLGTAFAFYAQVPVKLAQSALYTAALIPVIKLLGKGIDSFCDMDSVKNTIEGLHGWMMVTEYQPEPVTLVTNVDKSGLTSGRLS
jgi:hypothetical protein